MEALETQRLKAKTQKFKIEMKKGLANRCVKEMVNFGNY